MQGTAYSHACFHMCLLKFFVHSDAQTLTLGKSAPIVVLQSSVTQQIRIFLVPTGSARLDGALAILLPSCWLETTSQFFALRFPEGVKSSGWQTAEEEEVYLQAL